MDTDHADGLVVDVDLKEQAFVARNLAVKSGPALHIVGERLR